MNKTNHRIWLLFFLVGVMFIIIILRLFYLQVIRYEFFKKKSRIQQEHIVTLSPERGRIFDRNHQLLAGSLPAYSCYADPTQIENILQTEQTIREVLGISGPPLNQNSRFVWIKHKITADQKEKLQIKGLYFLPDVKRVYPGNTIAGQILGFVGLDDAGLSGIEYYYNHSLQGKAGQLIMESDPSGKQIFSYDQKILPSRNGKDMELTIDKVVQFIMENQLRLSVESLKAESGMAILMDIHTGEIWGLAQYPEFDPNKYWEYKNSSVFQNQLLSMSFEPGSIMKLFTIAASIEEHQHKMSDKIFIPQKMVIGGTVIEEAHDEVACTRSIADILIKSLNVGAATVGLELGKDKLSHYLKDLEFGKKTGIELPGESVGIVKKTSAWSQVDLSRISFGYSMSATPLQIIKAASVFGNDGYEIQPYILKTKHHVTVRGKRIFSPKTIKAMLNTMQRTVEEGTGEMAKMIGYSIGGKTGTARRFLQGTNTYVPGQYNTSFIGIFPISNPQFIMYVVIVDPETNKFASETAVPAFKGMTEQIIRYLDFPPDVKPTMDKAVIDHAPVVKEKTTPQVTTPKATTMSILQTLFSPSPSNNERSKNEKKD